MKKKTILFIIAVIIMTGGYFLALNFLHEEDIGEAPVITIDSDMIEVSVKDDKATLLKGVSASDPEDGDLTSQIVVDNVSAFDANGQRMVTYAVFDSDNHVTKATRLMTYTDYTAPRFYFTGPMINSSISTSNITKYLGATSSVDGDITERVYLQTAYQSDYKAINAKATVSDSTGTSQALEFVYYVDDRTYNIDINLKKYLVYLSVGETFDLQANIDDVQVNHLANDELINEVIITGSYDPNTPGVYEIEYNISSYGDHGRTQCLIVVQ